MRYAILLMAIGLGACGGKLAGQSQPQSSAAVYTEIQSPSLPQIIYFATASTHANEANTDSIVQQVSNWAKSNNHTLVLEGHCDERGGAAYNLELGDRRAHEIKALLVAHGIDDKRLLVTSKGKTEPASPGHSEAAWRQNRRVVISTVP